MEQLNYEGDKENSVDAGQLQRPMYSLLQPAETALVEQLLAQVMQQKFCAPKKLGTNLKSGLHPFLFAFYV